MRELSADGVSRDECREGIIRAGTLAVALRLRLPLLCLFFLAGFFLFLFAKPASAVATPPDFEDALVASVGSPTALAFTPDGRMLMMQEAQRLAQEVGQA